MSTPKKDKRYKETLEKELEKHDLKFSENPSFNEVANTHAKVSRNKLSKGTNHNKSNNHLTKEKSTDKKESNVKLLSFFTKYFFLPKAETDEEIANRIELYFNDCMQNKVKPTLEGVSFVIGIDTHTFVRWRKQEGVYPETHRYTLAKKAHELIKAFDSTAVVEGEMNPVVYIFRSKNYYGMTDEQKVTIKPEDPLGEKISEQNLIETIERDVIDNE